MSSPAGFLQVFDLVLTTQTPLFIGDGKTILKKSYLYDKRTNQVSIFDEEKFFPSCWRKILSILLKVLCWGALTICLPF